MTEKSRADDLKKGLEDNFEDVIDDIKVRERKPGKKENKREEMWIKTSRESVKDIISYLCDYHIPHISVMFGKDIGEAIKVSYIFSMFYGKKFQEVSLVISMEVPKDDLWIESITDIVEGALTTERDIKEMFGIEIRDIPDERNVYLPYDHPDEIHPLRRDETTAEMEEIYDKEGQK